MNGATQTILDAPMVQNDTELYDSSQLGASEKKKTRLRGSVQNNYECGCYGSNKYYKRNYEMECCVWRVLSEKKPAFFFVCNISSPEAPN